MCVDVIDMYLAVLNVAAWFAEALASIAVSLRWNSAKVSRITMSKVRDFLFIIFFPPTGMKPVGLKIKLGYLLTWNGPLRAKN